MVSSHRRALVVFPDEWLAFSPTVLNLVACLRPDYDVTVIAVDNGHFEMPDLDGLRTVRIGTRTTNTIRRAGGYRAYKLARLTLTLAGTRVLTPKYSLAIGVDSIGFLAARLAHPRPLFLSLEVQRNRYFRWASRLGIERVAIQTPERFNYLFQGQKVPVSYLPNSPLDQRVDRAHRRNEHPIRLIYFGLVHDYRGLDASIEAVQTLGSGFQLVLRGCADKPYLEALKERYSALLQSGQLRFDNEYVPQEHVVQYLSKFDIGLCFYDTTKIAHDDFNYMSCPSGKLFNYYNAGIPVVGSDILGLRSVDEYRAGSLVGSLTGDSIATAVRAVVDDYDTFAANSFRAADRFDFRRAFDGLMSDWTIGAQSA